MVWPTLGSRTAKEQERTEHGAEPPAGSRGRALGQVVRGAKPPEDESILVIGCPTEPANLALFQKCLALQGMNGLTVYLSALRKTSANN